MGVCKFLLDGQANLMGQSPKMTKLFHIKSSRRCISGSPNICAMCICWHDKGAVVRFAGVIVVFRNSKLLSTGAGRL